RDYFMYDRNSYTTGEFNVEIVLPNPVDTITVNITDNYYNQTTETIVLNAEMYDDIEITNFLIYPNPLQDNKGIWFTFNLSNSGLVDIKIFTIAGRLIKTINNVSCGVGYNQIHWETFDEYGGIAMAFYILFLGAIWFISLLAGAEMILVILAIEENTRALKPQK
ncbi:unnamed protein product, partial [marine sediment metagenome]